MTGSVVGTVRRHLAMGVDQVWVLSRHRVGKALGRPGRATMRPLDGGVRFAMVVVNFSTTRFLKLLLLTLVEQSALGLVHRIVIVDNGSVDGGVLFLRRLAGRSPRVELVERHHLLDHARGLRAGVSHLWAVEHDRDPSSRCNVYLFCDPDVIFRSTDALHELAAAIVGADAALAGEWRGDRDDPDIQASFLAVRADAYASSDVVPPVHHGSPTMWMQRSIARAGDLPVVNFASNHGGFILHRGRSGVAAARGTMRRGYGAPLHGRARRRRDLDGGRDPAFPAARDQRRARAGRPAGRAVRGARRGPTNSAPGDCSLTACRATSRSICISRSSGRRKCCSADRSMPCSCCGRPASRCGCPGSPRSCGPCSSIRFRRRTWPRPSSTSSPWTPRPRVTAWSSSPARSWRTARSVAGTAPASTRSGRTSTSLIR